MAAPHPADTPDDSGKRVRPARGRLKIKLRPHADVNRCIIVHFEHRDRHGMTRIDVRPI